MVSRKKKAKNGDVFTFKLSDQNYGYGQLLERSMLGIGCYVFYDIMAKEHPTVEQIIDNPILFIAFTVDYKIDIGEWQIIGNTSVPENLTIPEFKMDYVDKGSIVCMVIKFDGTILRPASEREIKSLNTMKSYTPNFIESVVKAKFDLIPWDNSYGQLLNVK